MAEKIIIIKLIEIKKAMFTRFHLVQRSHQTRPILSVASMLPRPSFTALMMPDQRFGLRVRVAREPAYSFENERK